MVKSLKSLLIEVFPCIGEAEEIVNTRGNFKVYFRGVDDPGSVKKFDDLTDVARYIQGRDGGPDYRRKGGLQSEYGQYAFEGFNWEDLLDGDPRSADTKYKVHLTNLPLKLKWVHRVPDKESKPFIGSNGVVYDSPYSDAWYGYEGSDSGHDITAVIFLDKAYAGRERFYHPSLWTHGYSGKPEKTLDAAKKSALELVMKYRKYMKDTYGSY